MTNEEAQQIYDRLFVAFPLIREWLAKVDNPQATYAIWCGVLVNTDKADADEVITRMISGEEPMPEAYERDRTPQMIRRAASEIRSQRLERQRMTKLHGAATEAKTTDQKFMSAMRESWRLGAMLREKQIDKSTNDSCVEDLIEWSEHGAAIPDWISKD